MSLSKIDDLIDAKDYTSALKELAKYIDAKPDEFDDAQKRVKKILKYRNIYNNNAGKLVQKMGDENSSDDEKMDIILGMEKSEQNRGAEAVALTNDARRSVALQYYINRSNRIMKQCSDLVAEGTGDSTKYGEAVVVVRDCLPPALKTADSDIIYYEGQEINVVYDKKLQDDVNACVKRINSYNPGIAIDQCELAYKNFIAAVQEGSEIKTKEAFTVLQSRFNNLAVIRNKLLDEGKVLGELDKRAIQKQIDIQKERGLEPTVPDTTYITFGKWGVLGVGHDESRDINGADTGMIGAIDAYWNTRVESMKNEIVLQIQNRFNNVALTFSDDDLFSYSDDSLSVSERNKIIAFADSGKNVQSLYGLLNDNPLAKYTKFDVSMEFVKAFAANFRVAAGNVKVIADENRKDHSVKSGNFTEFKNSYFKSLNFYNSEEKVVNAALADKGVAAEKERELAELNKPESKEKYRTTSGVQVEDVNISWNEAITVYDKILGKSAEECRNRQSVIWTEMARTYSGEADDRYAAYTLRFAEAKKTSGVDSTSPVDKHHPSKVIAELTKLNNDITSTKTVLKGFLSTLDGGSQYREKDSLFDRSYVNIQNVITNMDLVTADSSKLIASCQDRVNQARIASREADNLYNKAVRDMTNAIKKQDNDLFNSARENMNAARRRYNDSLTFEDDDELRSSSDAKLAQLDANINENQQKVIVARTRQLKTAARDSYYNGNFDDAERSLTQAKTMWAITNGDNLDRETEDLLAMVNRALTMKTGRTIPVTAPLYPEMSQILSVANQYYDQGAKLKKQGKDKEAEEILNQAKEKLRILQIVYPLNQDAALLTLKIDRLIDSQKFEKDFAQKVSQAIKDSKVESKQQQAYADLEDLYKINPKYPGIASTITELEYDLGIKTRPVTDTTLTRSKSLYSEALRIYNSARGDEKRLNEAVAKLDEAIRLNPKNSNAISLKDKISSESGGKATSVLSAEDESTYRQIIQVMNNGNLINALSMTEGLMKKGNNSRNKQLQDLRNRIRGLLGMS